MNEKRRDKKGRILNTGESQESNGLYVYKYIDLLGDRKKITSWRLTQSDITPVGKTDKEPLRDQIKKIKDKMSKGVCSTDMTVIELVDRYLQTLTGLKHNTESAHNTVVSLLSKHPFGRKRIDSVKMSDAKLFFIKLQKEQHKRYSTLHNIRGVLRPAFQMAVDDDLLVKNPFDFYLCSIIANDMIAREAIDKKQEKDFLEFVKNDNHYKKYYEGIYILFKTGLRISEFCGLTVSDIDLVNNEIKVDHQLQRTRSMDYIIVSTKTKSGSRVIPINNDVADAFRKIINNRKNLTVEPIVDGYTGFLYYDKNYRPLVAMHWEKYFQFICERYNKTHRVKMPKVTPHVCRHTYCSNMAKSGMNPKVLQYLMGHSDIGVTLNTYTHLGLLDAKEEMQRLSQDNTNRRRNA